MNPNALRPVRPVAQTMPGGWVLDQSTLEERAAAAASADCSDRPAAAVKDLMDNSAALVEHLKGMQGAALQLAEACSVACMAEELLRREGDNVSTLAALADGEPQPETRVAAAMQAVEGVFQMRWKMLNNLRQAQHGMAQQLKADTCEDGCHLLPPSVLVAHNKAWNQTHSALLHLPDSALHLVARALGRASRTLCRRFADVYGSPGSALHWSPKGVRAPSYPALMTHLLTRLRAWPWRHQTHTLRLCSDVPISLEARSEIAALMPQLRALHCQCPRAPPPQPLPPAPAPGSNPAPAANGNPAPAPAPANGNPAPANGHPAPAAGGPPPPPPTPPSFPSLQDLTCLVPLLAPFHLPYHAPAVTALELELPSQVPRNFDVAGTLVHLPRLRSLHLATCGAILPPEVRANVLRGIEALAGTLQVLSLSDACSLGDVLVAAAEAGRFLQVERLVLHERVARALEVGWLPTLRQLPRLQCLELDGTVLQQCTLPDLTAMLHGGSTQLHTLRLPSLMFFGSLEQSAMHAALRALWPQLPAVTTLECGCIFGRYGAEFAYQAEQVVGPAWLGGLEKAARLRQLVLKLDVEELGLVTALRPLSLLTSLRLDVQVSLPLAAEFAVGEEVAGRLGVLTQLRYLGLAVRCGVSRCGRLRGLVAAVVRRAAGLPLLEVLSLRHLTKVDGVVLEALLDPSCRVPNLRLPPELRNWVEPSAAAGGAGSSRGVTGGVMERLRLKYDLSVR